jgi:hypothetical protein
MCCEQDNAVGASIAEWLAELSDRARAQGKCERADRLLLLAWQAYDGLEVSLEDVEDDRAGGPQPRAGAELTSKFRSEALNARSQT